MSEVGANPSAVKATATPSRERILLAGKHLFARNGYENTSTIAIAREAGTSESQLMKHFGSKQGLLAAILDRGWMSIMGRVQALHGLAQPAERLYGMLEAIVVELEQDQGLKELMTLEARRIRKDTSAVQVGRGYRQFAEMMEMALSEMRGQGQVRADLNLEAVRSALIGMIESLLRDQVVAKRSDLRASYSFDDVKRLLEVLLPALAGEDVQPLKFAKG